MRFNLQFNWSVPGAPPSARIFPLNEQAISRRTTMTIVATYFPARELRKGHGPGVFTSNFYGEPGGKIETREVWSAEELWFVTN